jgi:dihydrofolate synthase
LANPFILSGPTRGEKRISEARSYFNLAAANSFFDLIPSDTAPSRILLEERALDSYSNVLFSLIQFWQTYRAWPQRLTIVSHSFKRERLVDCHCGAIRFPLSRVDFVGIDPPGMRDGSNEVAIKGVVEAVTQWKDDPHGKGELLAGKRHRRNPWTIDQALFVNEKERQDSGVRSMIYDDAQEYLIDGAAQPWTIS